MERRPFQSRELIDFLFDFSAGVDAGRAPIIIPKNQMSFGANTTVRRSFVTHRPPVRKIALEFPGYTGEELQLAFENGRFQGACVFNPDNDTDALIAQISGRLYKLPIVGDTAQVLDITVPNDPNDPNELRAWCWQAEKWIIVTDGTSKVPIFHDGVTSRRSNAGQKATGQSTLLVDVVVPNTGATLTNVFLTSVFTGKVGDIITIDPVGGFTVAQIVGPQTLNLTNYSATPIGSTAVAGNSVTWITTIGTELPAGRMGVYGLGRNWLCLLDGKQFIASDLVGGSSGTLALNFRDAVLKVTENDFLLGGGLFTIPGAYGEIRAMLFSETLDASLGQGALQIFTDRSVFSCNAPVDRLTWQSLVNPILTESAKGGGGLSQWSTINVNSDIMSRARDGIRTLILSRREFNTWGNVPISREVEPQINRDSDDLLRFSSAVVFDNRGLMTTEGVLNDTRGVYFTRLIPINYDPESTLRGKEAAVYDALYWQGLNILRILEGTFANTKRCFMFTLNNRTAKIELWELLPSSTTEIYDDGEHRIVWSFEAFLDFGQRDPRLRERLRLDEGEIYVDDLRGTVDFQAYFRPDDWPCWVPWHSWQECYNNVDPAKEPMFKPNMGLGEAPAEFCDESNNRPLREGYTFHFKLVITGHCRFKGARFGAYTVPQPNFSPPICTPICPDELIENLQS